MAPRLVQLTFAQLPQEQDGQLYWCKDCQQTNPCQGGGGGSLVTGAQGRWSCSTGGSGGSAAFPLGSDVSAASHRIEGLATDLTAGDALSRGQSSLSALAAPTTAFNLNNQKLQGLAAGGVAGDAIAFAQGNAQLKHNQLGVSVVSQSSADGSGSSVTITAPTSISNGNALVMLVTQPTTGETYTPPAGFAQIGSTFTNTAGATALAFCKTAASESGNYTISWSTSNYYNILLVNLTGTNCSQFDAASGSNGGNAGTNSTISIASFATTHENDFVLAASGQNAGSSMKPQIGAQLYAPGSNGFVVSALLDAYPPTPAISFTANGTTGALAAVAVTFAPSSTITSAPILHGSSGGQVNDLAGSFNGTINVLSATAPVAASAGLTVALGATGDGNHDDTAALQNAVDAACGMTSYAGTAMYVHNGYAKVFLPYTGPTGCYKITQPIRLFCGSLDFGSDTHTNVWGAHARLCPNFAGPALVAESPAVQNLSYATSLLTRHRQFLQHRDGRIGQHRTGAFRLARIAAGQLQ